MATSWDPNPDVDDALDPTVSGLAVLGDTVYVGGDFSAIGGESYRYLAAVDATTGVATKWNPDVDNRVWCLAVSSSTVYAGGKFTRLGSLPCAGLAAISPPAPPIVVPKSLALAQNIPNPVHVDATIHFALPAAAPVTLAVYDIQGRRVVILLDQVLQQAGPHDVLVQAGGWRPGVYLYRLEAGGASATRKMLVVK
jgi:hypothetical protein